MTPSSSTASRAPRRDAKNSANNGAAMRLARASLGAADPIEPSSALATTQDAALAETTVHGVVLPGSAARRDDRVYIVPFSEILVSERFSRKDLRVDDPEILQIRESIRGKGTDAILEAMSLRFNPSWSEGGLGYSRFPYEMVAGSVMMFCAELEGFIEGPFTINEMDDVEAAALSIKKNLLTKSETGADVGRRFNTLYQAMKARLDKHLRALTEIQPVERERYAGVIRRMNDAQYEKMLETVQAPDWIQAIVERSRRENKPAEVTYPDIAARVNLSVRTVQEKIMMAGMPEYVQIKMREGFLTDTDVDIISRLKGEELRLRLAREMARRRTQKLPMSVEEATRRVREIKTALAAVTAPPAAIEAAPPATDEHVVEGEIVDESGTAQAMADLEAAVDAAITQPIVDVVDNTPLADAAATNESGTGTDDSQAQTPTAAAETQSEATKRVLISAPLGNPSLAVSAMASAFTKGTKEVKVEMKKQASTAILWLESVPQEQRAALYHAEIAPAMERVRRAQKEFFDEIEKDFATIQWLSGVESEAQTTN